MGSDELPSVLHELLKPAPCLLLLLDRGQPRCAGLVLGELGADQIQHRRDSFLDLYAICLPGVPVFDQVLDMLFSIGLEHYDKFQRKNEGRQSTTCYDNKYFVVGIVKVDPTSQLPIPGLELLDNHTLAF